MAATEGLAPAKINLTLHVTGRRDDGYHLLDSLVVFTALGDRVGLVRAPAMRLRVSGPMAAGVPEGEDNLALRAARLAAAGDFSITLDKRLPMASGLGGGSTDAAAVLRAIALLSGQAPPSVDALLGLGADLPVCMAPGPWRMRGIGEVLDQAPAPPPLWLVLVNPGVAVPTGAVFAGLPPEFGAPMPRDLPRCADAAALAAFLRPLRNDLQAPAQALAPVIGTALAALGAQPGCLLARMSGSGATVWGLFAGAAAAHRSQREIARAEPGWWVEASGLLSDPS